MKRAVVGLATSKEHFQMILDDFLAGGFSSSEICTLNSESPIVYRSNVETFNVLCDIEIPKFMVERYLHKLREGHILIAIEVNDNEHENRAKEILSGAGGIDISSTSEGLGQQNQKEQL